MILTQPLAQGSGYFWQLLRTPRSDKEEKCHAAARTALRHWLTPRRFSGGYPRRFNDGVEMVTPWKRAFAAHDFAWATVAMSGATPPACRMFAGRAQCPASLAPAVHPLGFWPAFLVLRYGSCSLAWSCSDVLGRRTAGRPAIPRVTVMRAPF